MSRSKIAPSGTGGTREAILNAAVREFISYGYEGARMQRIADSSKANKAMIYYYYRSKEDIYNEVLREIVTSVIQSLNNIPEKPQTVREMLSGLIDAYQGFLSRHPDHLKLIQYELIRGGENLKKLHLLKLSDVPFNPINGRIYLFFKEKMRTGEIRKVEIIPLLFTVIGGVVIPFFLRPLVTSIMGDRLPVNLDALFDNLFRNRKDYIIDLVMQGLEPRNGTLQGRKNKK
jgi:TetR/AcrR family transcriptional regulator